ncbi:MAG: helix-turn-helix domain-containing protein [Paracoccaceae bacterium]|nr:helix-turn-helix domain-containing protein [Paracoccaceae bacterium]MDE2916072.1 helix-turn-helix domain-containing protein [Paracoccaceae bacterium]
MTLIRIKVDPNDPSTHTKGRIDYAKVDATTEEDIARHKKKDEAEALQEMARYIRQLRRRLNFSRKEFAQHLRISPNTVRQWEEGKRFPSRTSCSLLRILDKEPDAVLRVFA